MGKSFCTGCGHRLNCAGERFCTSCGAEANPAGAPQTNIAPGGAGMKKLVLVFGGLALAAAAAFAWHFLLGPGAVTARIVEIHSVDGPDITLTRAEAGRDSAVAGARLNSGDRLATGAGTIGHLRLDTDSLMRMDQSTRISVSQATDTLLAISVDEGQALFDVYRQQVGHDFEVRLGNHVIGVRGTLFVAGYEQVLMLEGRVRAAGEYVGAGHVMEFRGGRPIIGPIDINRLDTFAMQAVIDHSRRVLDAGALTEEEIELIRMRLEDPRNALVGVWEGTYHNNHGINGARFEFYWEGLDFRTVFGFFPVEGSVAAQRAGSYHAAVEFDDATDSMEIRGSRWIDNPGGFWFMIDFFAEIAGDELRGHQLGNPDRPMQAVRQTGQMGQSLE